MAEFNNIIPIICISGATASGKSSFAVDLAKNIGGEIINADSVQVYKYFDIGSGKISEREMQGVPHHLISHVDPLEQYSAGRFKKEALSIAKEILSRDKIPIVVGGTGLYLRALFSKFINFQDSSIGDDFLLSIEKRMSSSEFNLWCYNYLNIVDVKSAQRIGKFDTYRLQKALSSFLNFGLPNSIYREINNHEDLSIRSLVFIIDREREELYKKINQRVIDMVLSGWINEVKKIYNDYPEAPGLKALGYKHIKDHLIAANHLESLDLEILINNIQRDTRRFAKRQRTWWNNQPITLGWLPAKKFIQASVIENSSCTPQNNFSYVKTLEQVSGLARMFFNVVLNDNTFCKEDRIYYETITMNN